MLVSILLPTRGRLESLEKSVKSLIDNAIEPEKVEILMRIDDDDEVSLSNMEKIKNLHTHTQVIVGSRHKGYQSLHTFCNELAEQATGKWLFIWNDDAIMISEGWDFTFSDLESEGKAPALIQVGEKHKYSPESQPLFTTPFPIINKIVYEKLGHISPSYYNDTYVGLVFIIAEHMSSAYYNLNGRPPKINLSAYYGNMDWVANFNITHPHLLTYNAMSEIMVEHQRPDITGDNNDDTWKQGVTLARQQENSSEHIKSVWPQIIRDALDITELYIQGEIR